MANIVQFRCKVTGKTGLVRLVASIKVSDYALGKPVTKAVRKVGTAFLLAAIRIGLGGYGKGSEMTIDISGQV